MSFGLSETRTKSKYNYHEHSQQLISTFSRKSSHLLKHCKRAFKITVVAKVSSSRQRQRHVFKRLKTNIYFETVSLLQSPLISSDYVLLICAEHDARGKWAGKKNSPAQDLPVANTGDRSKTRDNDIYSYYSTSFLSCRKEWMNW